MLTAGSGSVRCYQCGGRGPAFVLAWWARNRPICHGCFHRHVRICVFCPRPEPLAKATGQ